MSRALGRLQAQGGSLGNRDRREIRRVRVALALVAQRLDGGLTADPTADRVAATVIEVVQPMYGRGLLAEHLSRAQALLATLLHAEPELEKVVLHPAQLAWLAEFLSACCLALLRHVATRHLPHRPLAYGS